MSLTIPFVVDYVKDVVISLGWLEDERVQVSLETKDGIPLQLNRSNSRQFFFEDNELGIGEYKLIITSGDEIHPYQSKLNIQAESDLQMETIIIASTANTNKLGSIQTQLYFKDGNLPVENATVSVGTHIFDYTGNGLYVSTFPPGFIDESVLIDVSARGYFKGVAFQRNHVQVVKALSGELVLTGPYNWHVLHDLDSPSTIKSIILDVGVDVKKKGKYEVSAWITDVNDRERPGMEKDWLAKPTEDSKRKRAGSGDEWYLDVGHYNLELDFEVSEVLECGKGPYRLYRLDACYNYDENTCDAISEITEFPLLILDGV
jgi:hypothetical protein